MLNTFLTSDSCLVDDEKVRLFDLRRVQEPVLTTQPLGGGIWRMKWHPISRDRMLVAAMHGGCRVVDFAIERLPQYPSEEDSDYTVTTTFTEHQSMAYGVDWLVHEESRFEAAMSCSFYDRAVFIWETGQ